MKIRLKKKWEITSDNYGYLLSEIKLAGKDSKKECEEVSTIMGHYQHFHSALTGVAEQTLLKSEATTLIEVKQEIADLKRFIKEELSLRPNEPTI